MPRIDQFRPSVEARVGKALGVPVSIGRISARSNALFPTVELHDVALQGPAAGSAPLRLQRVVATVSPTSIWRAGFEQLVVGGPDLEVRRDSEGEFSIAGLNVAGADDSKNDSRAADWLFAQPDLVIEGGTLRFVDDLSGAAPVRLEQVNLVLRNKGRSHIARLSATPPADWGQRFQLVATMRQPLLSFHNGRWREWSGQLHADLPSVDLARLRDHAIPGADMAKGRGALRLWAEVKRAQPVELTAELAFDDVQGRLGKDLAPLAFRTIAGRVDWRRVDDGHELSARQLRVVTGDGVAWPGETLRLLHQNADPQRPARGEFSADKIDLALLAAISRSVPIDAETRDTIARHAPKGVVQELQASWQSPADAPLKYRAKGRISGLDVAAQPAPKRSDEPGVPGVRGASGSFEFDQAGGKATFAIDNGALSFPGVFEDPVVPINQLSTSVTWQLRGDQWEFTAPDLTFANADATGQARIAWRTADPATSRGKSRFPGVLDLEGALSRADGTKVHRYLPLVLPPDVRRYVREAVSAGKANSVKFKVRGDLHELPFTEPARGEFRIAANVQGVTFAFVPRGMQPAAEPPWPALTQLSGELVFDRASMQINDAHGRLGSGPGLPVTRASATIPNLDHAVVAVDAELRAPLPDMLATVRTSPVDALIDGALARATGSGDAGLKLKLSLPISKLEKSTVQGSVTLEGNNVRIVPDSPLLERASGVVTFTENGFSIDGAGATLYGGDARIDGGSVARDPGAGRGAALAEFRASGSASAQGLRKATELGLVTSLAQHLSGSARYDATLRVRRDGPELVITSDLQGMASQLPAPLSKAADTALALRLENAPIAPTRGGKARDRLSATVGDIASASYVRDVSGKDSRALQGSLIIGSTAAAATAPMPDDGVAARIELAQFDVDEWQTLSAGPGGSDAAGAADPSARSYWPTQWKGRIGRLDVNGYRFNNVSLKGSREAALWRSEVNTDELGGKIEFREDGSGPGRLSARLARLVLPEPAPAAASRTPQKPMQQLPALDIVVDDFELRGRKLGRLEIDAVNRTPGGSASSAGAREWRLNKLNVTTPEARFSANGSWAQAAPNNTEALRTTMDFELDFADSDALLARFGMKDVIRRGRGVMQGRLAWDGSPLSFDVPSLGGQFHLSVESGQFLKADPGLAKLLGVLSLQALPRRLSLDFRDVFSDGFAFDFIRGDVTVARGVASSNNLQMKGATAAVLMEGRADIEHETQDLKVVVVPEVDAGTAALVATVINPAIGLGTFLAQYFLRKPLSEAATQEFRVQGTWADPHIEKVARRPVQGAGAPIGASISIGPVQ